MSKQNKFLAWLKQPKTLKRLGYISITTDIDKVHSAYKEAIVDYKRVVMYFTGSKLWRNHRNAFREHKKYYSNHLMRPYGMSIVNFIS